MKSCENCVYYSAPTKSSDSKMFCHKHGGYFHDRDGCCAYIRKTGFLNVVTIISAWSFLTMVAILAACYFWG